MTEEQVIAELARKLGFETLKSRNRDDLDFREVAVWTIREALSEAFHAGGRSVLDQHAKSASLPPAGHSVGSFMPEGDPVP